MLDFAWKVFCMTGNLDTYLLLREMEAGSGTAEEETRENAVELDYPNA
jgi:hypothetical protein